jgi:hypothetical protein
MGETAIDEPTFQEFLDEMREHYTADKVSNLWLLLAILLSLDSES